MRTNILLTLMIVMTISACGSSAGKKGNRKSDEIIKLEEQYQANPTDTSSLKALGRAYAAAGMMNDAQNQAVKLCVVVTESSGGILGIYEQGVYSAELYRNVGDEESARMALEDARIFINRQSWGELSEEETAQMNECLEKLEEYQ